MRATGLAALRCVAGLLSFGVCAGQAIAQAPAEPAVLSAEAADSRQSNMGVSAHAAESDERWFQGTFVGGVAGELALLERSRVNDGGPLALGVGFFGVVAPRWSPLMFGLGFGFMTVGEESARGPVVLWTQTDLQLTTTTVVRSTQLRHAEALLRFEPFGGIVRPFVEGTLGVVAVWESTRLDDAYGEALESVEVQRDIGMLWGGTLGLDLQLFPMTRDETGTYGLLLTAGVRRWLTTSMGSVAYAAADDGTAIRGELRAPLRLWVPFVALSLGVDSRAEARAPAAR